MKRLNSLSDHVVQFCRTLRYHHFQIGPLEEKEVLQSLTLINWEDPNQFHHVLKATLCKSRWQTLIFNDIFGQYWKELESAVDAKTKQAPEEKEQPSAPCAPSIEVIKEWLHGHREIAAENELPGASADEMSGTSDLTAFREINLNDWRAVVQLIQRYVARLPSRRKECSNRPGVVDFRRTLSRNLTVGELIRLSYRRQKENKTQMVLLCDVSRSMEMYSRFMIEMMYALQNSQLNLRTFVFSTSLYDISQKLKNQELSKSLNTLGQFVDQWSGGTRIGECFQKFVDQYGSRLLHRNSFVFIVSDGWESGDIDQLRRAMQQLRKRAKKIIWINPLARSEYYTPEVLGMKAVLPYLDFLMPTTGLVDLKKYLAKMK